MLNIAIWADGAAKDNNNKEKQSVGGYGVVIIDYTNRRKKELKKAFLNTTNSKMELLAVIDGFKNLPEDNCNVNVYSDSKYVTDAFNKKWIDNWQKHNWKKSDKTPVKNKELWIELLSLIKKHICKFHWIKGHNGTTYNERCDELANIAIEKLREQILTNF